MATHLQETWGGSTGKESACNVGDLGSIPGLGRSPGVEKGYPLQYFCLENSMDCRVHGVPKGWTRPSDFHSQPFNLCCLLIILLWDDIHIQPLSSISWDGEHFFFPFLHSRSFWENDFIFWRTHCLRWLKFFTVAGSLNLAVPAPYFSCPATLSTHFKTVPVSVAFHWGRIVNILRVKPYVYSSHPSFW